VKSEELAPAPRPWPPRGRTLTCGDAAVVAAAPAGCAGRRAAAAAPRGPDHAPALARVEPEAAGGAAAEAAARGRAGARREHRVDHCLDVAQARPVELAVGQQHLVQHRLKLRRRHAACAACGEKHRLQQPLPAGARAGGASAAGARGLRLREERAQQRRELRADAADGRRA
jgi:hypothetical protein